MANKVHSVSFTLIAVIDGEDALTLEASPSAIIWNQEGDITADDDGTIHDNSSWPEMYVSASVIKGDAADGGWTFSYSKTSGSYTVKKGTLDANGTFTEDEKGNVFQLSSPVPAANSSSLWTNGAIKIIATKGSQHLSKDVSIALNALATWKMSVVNGTMSAVSQRTETQVDGKLKTYETRLTQNEEAISTKATKTELDSVAAGEGSAEDIDLTGKDENTFYLVLFSLPNIADNFTFGIKKDLYNYDNRTSYGLWNNADNDKGGFEVFVEWTAHNSGWGARPEDRHILRYTDYYVKQGELVAGSIGQRIENGVEYIYLRGGAKYHAFCDHIGINIRIATQSDIDAFSGETVKPSLTLSQVAKPVPEREEIFSEIKQTASSISATVTDLSDGVKKTGVDIENGKISLSSDKTEVQTSEGQNIALFDKNGLNAKLVNAEKVTSTAQDGRKVVINDGQAFFYGLNGVANIRFGVDSAGNAVLSYYDNDGNLLYDLGPNGIDASGLESARVVKYRYRRIADLGTAITDQKTYDVTTARRMSGGGIGSATTRTYTFNTLKTDYNSVFNGATEVGDGTFTGDVQQLVTLYQYKAAKIDGTVVQDAIRGLSAEQAKAYDGLFFTAETFDDAHLVTGRYVGSSINPSQKQYISDARRFNADNNVVPITGKWPKGYVYITDFYKGQSGKSSQSGLIRTLPVQAYSESTFDVVQYDESV